eukprot:232969-Amorphochlora_amoeboformis.AAC.1
MPTRPPTFVRTPTVRVNLALFGWGRRENANQGGKKYAMFMENRSYGREAEGGGRFINVMSIARELKRIQIQRDRLAAMRNSPIF